jgi:hypothetical protein
LAEVLAPHSGDAAGVQPSLISKKKPGDLESPTKKRATVAKKGPMANKPGGVRFFHL